MPAPTTQPLPGTTILPRFPDEDGRSMGDTDIHTQALIWLREALQDFFAGSLDWYVAMNLIFYWDLANPRRRRDPDVLVARVKNYPRRSFRVWEEKTIPCTLFEVLSRKTWQIDVGPKKEEYARVGVPEYFLFDPEVRYINPPVQGFRLRKGVYVPIRPTTDGSLTSRELGVRMAAEGPMLRLRDARTGVLVLTPGEARERSEERAEEERRQKEEERRQKEEERRQKEEERRQKEEERQRADALAAEVERLRAELQRPRNGTAN